jgi:hypothetical protein
LLEHGKVGKCKGEGNNGDWTKTLSIIHNNNQTITLTTRPIAIL